MAPYALHPPISSIYFICENKAKIEGANVLDTYQKNILDTGNCLKLTPKPTTTTKESDIFLWLSNPKN
jgi:hypothetical protein